MTDQAADILFWPCVCACVPICVSACVYVYLCTHAPYSYIPIPIEGIRVRERGDERKRKGRREVGGDRHSNLHYFTNSKMSHLLSMKNCNYSVSFKLVVAVLFIELITFNKGRNKAH